MIEILFLGTSCMQPTKLRNHSGILVTRKKENILLDCGEGTQRQMRIAGVKPAKITRLFVSHWHGDHVFGIPGLMSSMGADKSESKLVIYGPKGSKKYLEYMMKGFAAKDIIDHEVHEVLSGVFYENDEIRLIAQPLNHSVPCIGFRLEEKDRRKVRLRDIEKLGLSGPVVGKLQRGESVEVGGKVINPDDVSYITSGKSMCYVADTLPCTGANALAKNCDLVVSEGTHLSNIREKTERSMHLTAMDAALIASQNNAKRLVITHISPRYKTSQDIIDEARTYFDETVVAEDFMKVKV